MTLIAPQNAAIAEMCEEDLYNAATSLLIISVSPS
jgi:hypothetical protein